MMIRVRRPEGQGKGKKLLKRIETHQSATSSKPSSRAVLAIPGYISVYSWVSPDFLGPVFRAWCF